MVIIIFVIVVTVIPSITRTTLVVALLDRDQTALLLEPLGQRSARLHSREVLGVVYREDFAGRRGTYRRPASRDHPRSIQDDQRELEPEGTWSAAREIGEGEETALLVVLVEADEGRGDDCAHQPPLLPVVLGHLGAVLLAGLIPDRAVHD